MGSAGPGWTATRRGLLAGGGALAAAACTARRDPAALTLWAMSYEGDYSPLLMPAFTAATGIPVEVQTLPATAAHEKLLTAFAGGALPDVVMLYNDWVSEFAMIGAIAPVADPALLADVSPSVAGTTRFAGRDYAVPWTAAPLVQFFRRDLVEAAGYAEPPGDWPRWRAMAAALKRRRPDEFVLLCYLNWWETLFTLAGLTGAAPLRDRNTRGNFASPAFREALAFYVSLFDDGFAPRALSTEIQDPVAAFAQGFFSIYPSNPTLLLDLHRRRAEIPSARWSTARMPGPTGTGPVSATSAALAVTAASRRSADGWALIRHLTTPASQLRFQQLIGSLPAGRRAWAATPMADPVLAPFAAQMRDPVRWPAIAEWEQVRLEVQLIAERVVRGQLTQDQGVRTMDRQVDTILAKRRALVDAGRLA